MEERKKPQTITPKLFTEVETMDTKTLREAQLKIAEAVNFVTAVRDDEQETYDDKPETWQESDEGKAREEKIGELSEVIDQLEAIDRLIEDLMK